MKFAHVDLFSGIGGFAYGLQSTGHFETVAFCEIEDYARQVLERRFPGRPVWRDIREVTAETVGNATRQFSNGKQDQPGNSEQSKAVPESGNTGRPIVITGGFPCQDLSVAGKQAGIDAERSGLWSELVRIVGEVRPDYFVAENVAALLSGGGGWWFARVMADLADIGFDAEWHVISAADMGAPHLRKRIWIIAYPQKVNGTRGERERNRTGRPKAEVRNNGDVLAHPMQQSVEGYGATGEQEPAIRRQDAPTQGRQSLVRERGIWAAEPSVCGVDDGVSNGLDGYRGRVTSGMVDRAKRLKGLGNAIVPHIAAMIGEAIKEHHDQSLRM